MATVIQKHSLTSGYKVCAGKKMLNYRVYLTENNTDNNFRNAIRRWNVPTFVMHFVSECADVNRVM